MADRITWLPLADGGRTVWVNLAHVRQIQFTEGRDEPAALLWCGDDLWEIGEPTGIAALRAYVQRHSLTGD